MASSTLPPEISFGNYKFISNLMALSFIILSFRPPKSFLHSTVLIVLTTCFILQPIIYRGKYLASDHLQVAGFAITIGFKMLVWLKSFINKSSSDDGFQPFLYTLFYWRKNVTSGKKDDFQPTNVQIIKKILERILHILIKRLIFEGCFKLLDNYSVIDEIPSSPYFFRVFKYIYTIGNSTPPITIKLLSLYSLYMVLVYLLICFSYDTFLMNSGIVLLFLNIVFPRYEEGRISSIRRWCISFLFDTKYIFDSPWLSTSPREFWGVRWHTFYNESWKELGYIPLRNYLCSKSSSKADNKNKVRLAQLGGTLGAFFMSGILHEYLLWTEMNTLTLEQLSFFMFHGFLLIIWESFFYKEGNDNLRRIIFFSIVFFSLPSMIEPYFRCDQWIQFSTSHFTNINRVI